MLRVGVADFGIYSWSGGFFDYEDRIDAVKKIGFDGLERLSARSADEALYLAAMLKKKGMGFATCKVDEVEYSIKWTAALGGEYIWTDVTITKEMDMFCRRVNILADACEKYGIKTAIHNHLGTVVETQDQLEHFLKECPKVGIILDTGHLVAAGGDAPYIAEKYYDRLCAIHLKNRQIEDEETKKGYFCGLKQGNLDCGNEDVVKYALKNGYDKWVFIEHDTHKRDPYLDLAESYEALLEWGIRG